jgi:hypothetical protein
MRPLKPSAEAFALPVALPVALPGALPGEDS